MIKTNLVTVVLAAGKGTRMQSPLPKPMLRVGGKPMLSHVLAASNALDPDERQVVVGPDMDVIRNYVHPVSCVIQHDRLGTGHALQVAMKSVLADTGTLLVLNADVPLISPGSLARLIRAHQGLGCPVTVLGFSTDKPGSYGRLQVSGNYLTGIVEAKDATPEELQNQLCNGGIYAIDIKDARELLPKLSNNNAAGELYLTDLVALSNEIGLGCGYVMADEVELSGANNLRELMNLDRQFCRKIAPVDSAIWSLQVA